jgi:hypothetical protein
MRQIDCPGIAALAAAATGRKCKGEPGPRRDGSCRSAVTAAAADRLRRDGNCTIVRALDCAGVGDCN